MKLSDKIRYLREVEGSLRGLDRAMTQQELVRAIQESNKVSLSDIHTLEDKLDLWLIGGAERFRRDPDLCQALLSLAQNKDSRRCLLLLEAVLDTPSLVDRLLQVLRPEAGASQPVKPASVSTTQHKLTPTRSTSKRGKQ
jgi:hypothetical protein